MESIPCFPSGLKLRWLLNFAVSNVLWDESIGHVINNYVLSSTALSKCKYINLSSLINADDIGPPVTFISYDTSGRFGDLVAACCEGADLNRAVWIEMFCSNLWSTTAEIEIEQVVKNCSSFIWVCSSHSTIVRNPFNCSSIDELSSELFSRAHTFFLLELYIALSLKSLPIIVKFGGFILQKSTDGNNESVLPVSFRCDNDGLHRAVQLLNLEKAIVESFLSKYVACSSFSSILSGIGIATISNTLRVFLSNACYARSNITTQSAACGDLKSLEIMLQSPCYFGILAAEHGFSGVLMQLFARTGYDIDYCDDQGCTALIAAANCAQKMSVATLLSLGCDVNKQDKLGCTALMKACSRGSFPCVFLLLSGGASIDILDKGNRTALMYACGSGDLHCLGALLSDAHASGGPYIDSRDKEGNSAFMYAAMNGHVAVMSRLVELQGVECVNDTNTCGVTALMHSASGGHTQCLQWLISQGASTTCQDQNGVTVLICAAQNGHKSCIELLASSSDSIDRRDDDGITAYIAAAVNGHAGCLSALMEYGPDINAIDNMGMTALMWAALGGHSACVELLLQWGAESSLTDASGRNALSYAAVGLHTDCIRLLSSQDDCSSSNAVFVEDVVVNSMPASSSTAIVVAVPAFSADMDHMHASTADDSGLARTTVVGSRTVSTGGAHEENWAQLVV
jgi:ankyrin repeat protein